MAVERALAGEWMRSNLSVMVFAGEHFEDYASPEASAGRRSPTIRIIGSVAGHPAHRRCLICGIAAGNGAGIPVAAIRIQRTKRLNRHQGMHTALVTGICRLCLEEAMGDGRLRRSEAMLRMVPTG